MFIGWRGSVLYTFLDKIAQQGILGCPVARGDVYTLVNFEISEGWKNYETLSSFQIVTFSAILFHPMGKYFFLALFNVERCMLK